MYFVVGRVNAFRGRPIMVGHDSRYNHVLLNADTVRSKLPDFSQLPQVEEVLLFFNEEWMHNFV